MRTPIPLAVRGDRIRQLRNAHGWSQMELAYRAGLTQGTISQLETGRQRRAQPWTLARLAQALGVVPTSFFREPDRPSSKVP